MSATFEDISVAWGRQVDPHDQAWTRWWRAVFQDLAVVPDGSRLYFLYDPIADEESVTSSGRKGGPSIIVFDAINKKFMREIVLNVDLNSMGQLKYFFLINPQTFTFAICTQNGDQLHFWNLQLTPDGMNVASGLNPLFGPIPTNDDWMVVMREDCPEIVVMTGPGLTVWRINASAPGLPPVDSFQVPSGDLTKYYDAVVWRGKVYLLSARPDEAFDFSVIHVLDLAGRSSMQTVGTRPDPQAGFPPPRKQCGIDVCQGRLYLGGGEIQNQMTGNWDRFQDVWALDLANPVWQRVGGLQFTLPLIEPRLSTLESGLVHVWGDCDIEQGCLAPPTHIHILKTFLSHAEAPPPTYEHASAPPNYAGATGGGYPTGPPGFGIGGPSPGAPGGYPPAGGGNAPYPPQPGYPPQGGGAYPPQQGYPPQQPGYPPQQPGGYPPQQPAPYPTQQPGYPPQGGYPSQGGYPPPNYPQQPVGEKKGKKDCTVS